MVVALLLPLPPKDLAVVTWEMHPRQNKTETDGRTLAYPRDSGEVIVHAMDVPKAKKTVTLAEE